MMFTVFCCQCGTAAGGVANRIEENELFQCEDCEAKGKISKSEQFTAVIRYCCQTGKRMDFRVITANSLYYDEGRIKLKT